MERLKQMKECLTDIVENQIYCNAEHVDTKELGEAVDMIKDLAEAIYYCTITDAMEADAPEYERKSGTHGTMYYTPMKMREPYDPRHRERPNYDEHHGQKQTWDGGASSDGSGAWSMGTHPRHDGMMKDPYEGKSGEHRKKYMEGKHVGDKSHQMKELEIYMQELSNDITEMIADASPDEKMLLQSKIATLASKIK